MLAAWKADESNAGAEDLDGLEGDEGNEGEEEEPQDDDEVENP